MHVPAQVLQQAIALYLQAAYPPGNGATPKPIPNSIVARAAPVRNLDPNTDVPLDLLERDSNVAALSYVMRLGQPMYPHMKLVVDPLPDSHGVVPDPAAYDFILRVDSHDRHLHAAPGSPDAAWLSTIRMSNKELGDKIEAAWSAAGLPTFKEYLRRQLEARKKSFGVPPSGGS